MDLGELLEASGAILRGHFVLSSGRHSDVYFEKFRVLEQPHVLSLLCTQITSHFLKNERIELVAGPTTGGIIIAFEVARQMGLPAIYIESEAGVKLLRRNARIRQGANVLIVDDVLTTGTSLLECRTVVEEAGGTPTGFAVLIDRSEPGLDLELPTYASYRVQAQSWTSEDLPDWLASIPVTKPGTRPG